MKNTNINIKIESFFICAVLLIFSLVFSAFADGTTTENKNINDKIYQISTIDALLKGSYEGRIDIKQLLVKGNTGIGTFENLDGEMIVLDGICYKADSTGLIEKVKNDKTPFAAIGFFTVDFNYEINNVSTYEELKNILELYMINRNIFYLIIIEGKFEYIKYRSVPKQSKPYKDLQTIVKNEQVVFEKKYVEGTILGFYCPEYVKGVNVAGYHFHFIDKDRTIGGHLIDVKVKTAKVFLDAKNNLELDLGNPEYIKNLDFKSDTKKELEVVEKGK